MTQSTRVLLVSDSSDELEMYGHALRLGGYCTLQAGSGSTALRMAEELQPSAVVISEGRRPDAPDAIRLRSAAPAVVILANYMGTEPAGRETDGNSAQVLMKPCVPEDLVRTVDQLLASTDHPSRSQPLKRA